VRILHLVHTPRHSGAETLVASLSRIHSAQGHSCGVASFNPPTEEYRSDFDALANESIRLFAPDRPLARLQRANHFKKAAAEFRPDVIFAHSVLPALYGRIFRRESARFVTVLHSADEDDYRSRPLDITERFLTYRTDAVIAVSDKGAANYRRRFPKGASPRVIQNGIDLRAFQDAPGVRDGYRANLGLSAETRLILQVGRLSPVKGQAFTFEALQTLLSAHENILLWFAGLAEDEGYAAGLVSAVKRAGLLRQVKILGSRDDVPKLLAAADAYVMPSLQEAHSVAMIEALASGAPVVASTIPGFLFAAQMPAVVFVTPRDIAAFGDAVVSMLATPRATRDLSAFDIRRTAREYIELVESLIRTGK
jgi:glycosyltransferase involved in cell wall biosynthesis